jgi:phage tail sheath protein FI
MPEYLSPGVYVEEVPSGPVPIQGVGTSTTGMVGFTERGPTAVRLVTSWLEYYRWFGGHVETSRSYLPFAVQGFFDNGGQRLFVSRVARSDADAATLDLPTADPAQELQVRAIGPGAWGNNLFVRLQDEERPTPGGNEFRLTALYYRDPPPTPLVDPLDPDNVADANRREPTAVEQYDMLGTDPTGNRFAITTVNAASQLIQLTWTAPGTAPARPTTPVNFDAGQLQNGDDGAAAITGDTYRGNLALPTNQRTGLAALEAIDEIALLAVPDQAQPLLSQANRTDITNELVNQCERLKDRFAVLAVDRDQGDVQNIRPPRDSSYAAIYYPWIRVFEPLTADTVLVPPQGHVLGIYARTDSERGVHKAPANEEVRGIITVDLDTNTGPLEFRVTKGQHDILNPRGVDVIRDFRAANRGIRVWGGRTMSSDAQWRYINVRRLFIFVEESIDEGTQWVVFEGNYEPTWARVVRSVSNFLTSVWRDGALAGVTPEEAFFVRCDRTTMTPDDIDNGRLIALVGIAPVKPAEFVIFRISQKTIEAQA